MPLANSKVSSTWGNTLSQRGSSTPLSSKIKRTIKLEITTNANSMCIVLSKLMSASIKPQNNAHTTTLKAPLRIGISACLLGHAVRYDGENKRCNHLALEFTAPFEWIPFCPEQSMGIPRPPIQLVKQSDNLKALQVHDPQLDATGVISNYFHASKTALEQLDGFIFQPASPSCGLANVKLFNPNNDIIGTSSGLFAAAIIHHYPELPVIEANQLENKQARQNFIAQVIRKKQS